MDFNEHKNSYGDLIQESLRFSGKEHAFFTQVKAQFLKNIIKKYLPNVKTPELLDVGCGHGLIHSYLKGDDLKIVGVEVANEVLEFARKDHPEVNYLSHNGKTLPFEEKKFDIAIAICVMHHVPPVEWQAFLTEMKRVLKPGGIVVIFEHNPYNPMTRYIVANNILDADAVLLSSPKLKKLMQEVGLTHIKNRNILFTPFANRIFRWLDKVLGRVPFGAQYYAIGQV